MKDITKRGNMVDIKSLNINELNNFINQIQQTLSSTQLK